MSTDVCRRARAALRLGAVALLLSACQPASDSGAGLGAAVSPLQPPQRLSETGLFAPDGSIDPRNRPFSPQYPLWSDGATKSRWVRLPEGAMIDVSDVDAWRFPAGTTFWKEFAWNGRKIETRMLRALEGGDWLFAAYVWNDDQRDAVLAPPEGVPGVFEISPGKRHSIPGLADCDSCHKASPAVVLGFNSLQLSDDRDPLAPHAEPLPEGAVTMRSLVAQDRLRPPRPDLVARPPRIRETDPVARAALGYLAANCGGCHCERGSLGRLDLFLHHDAAKGAGEPEPAVATTARTGKFVIPGFPADHARLVVPGAPDRSTLLYRMKSRRPSTQMPPLGTVLADTEAIELVKRWIESLPPKAELAADSRH
ncbi:MAG: hypothetical protein RL885_22585 [Planctomycetota bacterium]